MAIETKRFKVSINFATGKIFECTGVAHNKREAVIKALSMSYARGFKGGVFTSTVSVI